MTSNAPDAAGEAAPCAAESELAALRRALDLTEDRLSLALESARMGSWDWDIDADVLEWTPMCKAIFGMAADAPISYPIFLDRLHPDDRARVDGLCQNVLDPDTRALYDTEYRTIWPDGSMHWVLARGRAYFLEGRAIRFIGAVTDVTEQKEAEIRLRELVNELAHRVKNTLAVVQSITEQTFRGASELESVHEALAGRLQALADTHTLLTQANWRHVEMADLVGRTLARPVPSADPRFSAEGPPIRLRPKAALALGLVLHELADNARRHGAWSVGGGSVACVWRRAGEKVEFEWSETGLANLATPARKGFGSKLIRQAVAYDVAGEAIQHWRPGGLLYRLAIPSEKL